MYQQRAETLFNNLVMGNGMPEMATSYRLSAMTLRDEITSHSAGFRTLRKRMLRPSLRQPVGRRRRSEYQSPSPSCLRAGAVVSVVRVSGFFPLRVGEKITKPVACTTEAIA